MLMGDVKTFRIRGSFRKGDTTENFTKELRSVSQERATELLYSLLGSNHKVKRAQVFIEKIDIAE